jgi:hypothetical protein
MLRSLPSLIAWAAPLLVAASGVAEPAGRVLDLWPLVVRDGRPVAGRATTRIGGPFFESFSTEREQGFTLRPLLARIEDEEREQQRVEFLYPLGQWSRDPDGDRFRLTPFVDSVQRPEEEGGKRGWSFALAFGGRTAEGEGYFGVFPLGGVAKKRFGLERLDFWLFPLFARRDASGYTKTHVLWPFFSFGSGGGRRTLRIWPFYGHDVRDGEFDRRFALWPFVHWRTERPGDPTLEKKALFVLPFYGRTRRPQARAHFVLGPLYMRAENDITGATQTDVFWPFLRFAQRPPSETYGGSRELRLEPFYRRREAPGFLQVGTLLGAVRRTTLRQEDLELDSLRTFWVSRFERSHEPPDLALLPSGRGPPPRRTSDGELPGALDPARGGGGLAAAHPGAPHLLRASLGARRGADRLALRAGALAASTGLPARCALLGLPSRGRALEAAPPDPRDPFRATGTPAPVPCASW